MTKLLFFVLLGLAAIAWAGVPAVVHSGQVLDAATNAPIVGVQVVAFFDDWPEDAQKHGAFTTQTDSMGVYHIGLSRPAEVLFIKTGYDSLTLHWPHEFTGVEQGGCGVNLGPVRLADSGK